MEVSSQFKFGHFMPRGRRSSYLLDRRLGGSQPVEMFAPIMEPRILGRPAHSPILPSELTRFHFSDFNMLKLINTICNVFIWYRAETSGGNLVRSSISWLFERLLRNTALHVLSTVQCCKCAQTRLRASRDAVCLGPVSFCNVIVSTALRRH
jgi:hypothetical protein